MTDENVWKVIDDLRQELSTLTKDLTSFKIDILEKYSNRLPIWATCLFMTLSSIIAALLTYIKK